MANHGWRLMLREVHGAIQVASGCGYAVYQAHLHASARQKPGFVACGLSVSDDTDTKCFFSMA